MLGYNKVKEWAGNAEADARELPIQKRRKIMLTAFLGVIVLFAIAMMLYSRWRDVALSVSDKTLCSQMAERGFQVSAGGQDGSCRFEHVNVDVLSAINPLASKYKANQGLRAFDINKNLVAVDR